MSAARMTPLELRASASLASLSGLRMLGLFLILPVFAVHAAQLPGGDNYTLVGLAMGIYGLTQGALQIPFGMASDRFGRKRIIVLGLVLFAAGSFLAATATDIYMAIVGRALQGAGAISAAITAFIADQTRDEVRTRAMAMVGASVSLTFAVSLMAAPALYELVGMSGIFNLTGALAIGGILLILFVVPREGAHRGDRDVRATSLREVLADPELMRLNFGIFALHAMQMALFVAMPLILVNDAGLPVGEHWKLYLPIVLLSFALMLPPLLRAERGGRMKQVFIGAVVVLLFAQAALALAPRTVWTSALLLLVFFSAFNVLEACLPSLVSRLAPATARGTALGVYNTMLAIGLFVGGGAGGFLMQRFGESAVFVFGIALVALWLVVASPMRPPAHKQSAPVAGAPNESRA